LRDCCTHASHFCSGAAGCLATPPIAILPLPHLRPCRVYHRTYYLPGFYLLTATTTTVRTYPLQLPFSPLHYAAFTGSALFAFRDTTFAPTCVTLPARTAWVRITAPSCLPRLPAFPMPTGYTVRWLVLGSVPCGCCSGSLYRHKNKCDGGIEHSPLDHSQLTSAPPLPCHCSSTTLPVFCELILVGLRLHTILPAPHTTAVHHIHTHTHSHHFNTCTCLLPPPAHTPLHTAATCSFSHTQHTFVHTGPYYSFSFVHLLFTQVFLHKWEDSDTHAHTTHTLRCHPAFTYPRRASWLLHSLRACAVLLRCPHGSLTYCHRAPRTPATTPDACTRIRATLRYVLRLPRTRLPLSHVPPRRCAPRCCHWYLLRIGLYHMPRTPACVLPLLY